MDVDNKSKKDESNKAISEDNRADSGEQYGKKQDKSQTKRIRWMTKNMAEHLGREEVLYATFREFLVYVTFVIFVTVYIAGNRTSAVFYLTKGLMQQFTEKEFETLNNVGIQFMDIRTATDFWVYVEDHFIKSLYWESYYSEEPEEVDQNAMNILGENIVLGVPRIRQVKMSNDSCVIHEYFRHLFLNCFKAYSMENEDKTSFGLKQEPAWVYADSSTTKSLNFEGDVSDYGGGGFYINLNNNKNETINTIQTLKDNLWVTRGTRAIFIDFSTYNANINLFAVCKLIFEFPSTGGVIPDAVFHSMKLIRFHSAYDYFVLGCEFVYYCFILFYALEELREFIYFKWRYFLNFWTYIDLMIIICAVVGAFTSIIEQINVRPTLNFIKEHPDEYGNLEYLASLHVRNTSVSAVNLFFIYIKVFKFLNFNKSMGQLNNTLSKCAWDILGFSLMFFIIFFAFAELGYLIFGNQVENFSSFGIAMFTLLRTILGDFDYSELEKANRILAPIYFISYIFLVFFVLLNMFLAIINDTYADVKTEIAIAPDEVQMLEYLRNKFKRMMRKFGCMKGDVAQSETKHELNVTIRQIRDNLKRCGFNDLEIEMFFARYNVHPLAEVNVTNVDLLRSELEKLLEESDDSSRFVRLDDFLAQQNKLEHIDRQVSVLVRHVKTLLDRLDEMENVRKTKM